MRWSALVLFACLPLSAAADEPVKAVKGREAVIVEIQWLKGRVDVDAKRAGQPVVEVELGNTAATDDVLAHLKVFTSLERLYLHNTKITERAWSISKGCPS